MNVLKAVRTRRSIGKLKGDVGPKTIRTLVEAAIWAPNHRLTKPWTFTVVRGDARVRLGEVWASQAVASAALEGDERKAFEEREARKLRIPRLTTPSQGIGDANALREAASALGTPKWKVIVTISYRAAIQGMLTGVMLAIARIAGETAPLLFTALNNQFWTTNMNGSMANLPVVIFQFALSPYADWQTLAWGGALLITLTVLFLNIGARALASWSTFKQ